MWILGTIETLISDMKTWILILVIIFGVLSFIASLIHLIKEAGKKNIETKKLIGLALDVAYLPVSLGLIIWVLVTLIK